MATEELRLFPWRRRIPTNHTRCVANMLIPREPTELVEWRATVTREGLNPCMGLAFTEADEAVILELWLGLWWLHRDWLLNLQRSHTINHSCGRIVSDL